jgi:hypothetical protein
VRTKRAGRAFIVPDEDTQHTIHIKSKTYSAVPVKVRIGAPPVEEAA